MPGRPHVVRLYDSVVPSGNGYKVHLAMAQLGISTEVVDLDFLATPRQTRTAKFLTMNPNGRIPLVELSDGTYLPESNAILGSRRPCAAAASLRALGVVSMLYFAVYSTLRAAP